MGHEGAPLGGFIHSVVVVDSHGDVSGGMVRVEHAVHLNAAISSGLTTEKLMEGLHLLWILVEEAGEHWPYTSLAFVHSLE